MTYKHLGKITVQEILALAGDSAPENLKDTPARLKSGKTITQSHAALLDDWIEEQKRVAQAATPAEPADYSMKRNAEYNRKVMQDVAEQPKRIEQRNAAIARLQQYEREQGLLNTQVNQEIINKFLVEAPELAEWRSRGSILSPEIIDAAIKWLRPNYSGSKPSRRSQRHLKRSRSLTEPNNCHSASHRRTSTPRFNLPTLHVGRHK